MRCLIVTALVICCSLCLAEDFPEDTNKIKSLTAEQAADLVMVVTHVREDEVLVIRGLTSIDKDVARELAKFKGKRLFLDGLTSIDKDVARELSKYKGSLYLGGRPRGRGRGLTSINKDVAQELAKYEGEHLSLNGLTSIDKDVAQKLAKFEGKELWVSLESIDEVSLAYLKSNPKIQLPQKYRD